MRDVACHRQEPAGDNHVGANITITDPSAHYSDSDLALITADAVAAFAMWQDVLAPSDTTIDINIIITTDTLRAEGWSTASQFKEHTGNLDIYDQGAGFELRTGHDANGSASDITIQLNPDFQAVWYWIDPLDGSTLTGYRTDLIDVFVHEIGHALAFNGWRDATTNELPGTYASTFDALVTVIDGKPYFTGAHAVAVYGGPVPLTVGNATHLGNASPGPGADLLTDVMNGVVFDFTRYTVSPLDVAILSDVGLATNLSDHLSGTDSADLLNGGAGSDTMSAGLGDDTYVVGEAGDLISGETSGSGLDTVLASVSWSLAGSFLENLTLTDSADIKATGSSGANVLTGNDGSNMLDGLAGADTMAGGLGSDTYSVENIADVVTELADQGTADTVKTNLVSYTLGANVENLILVGAGNINGTGNGLNNSLIGNGANNNLIGGAGDDTLSGGAGNDLLNGGTGADRLIGGLGNDTYQLGVSDTIIEQANAGIDTVLSSLTAYTLGATLENVNLIGSALNANGNGLDNLIAGNVLGNLLQGGDGKDTIGGMAGNDTINGGHGADVLSGGSGNDVFVYRALADSPSSTRDLITDLAAGDRLDLRLVDSDTITPGDQAFHQVVAFTHHATELVLTYDSVANRTLLTADVNGDAISDLFVFMTGDHTLAADWLL